METKNDIEVKRIVLIGPESTGKTELAEFLAKKFNTIYVPEYAREYVEKLENKYTFNDVEKIARKQVELENELEKKANSILFYDTFLIITKVWFQVVFNKVPVWIEQKIKSSKIDLFLLCNTELPWIKDNVRENGGEMREKLFSTYRQELENYGFKYTIINGVGNNRYNNALSLVNDFLEI